MPVITTIQIVCGDCGGDADFPIKTMLLNNGTCSRCGGVSYVLASRLLNALTEATTEHADPRLGGKN